MNQNRFQRLRRRLYEIVEVAKEGDKASRVFDLFIVSLITLTRSCAGSGNSRSDVAHRGAVFQNLRANLGGDFLDGVRSASLALYAESKIQPPGSRKAPIRHQSNGYH